MHISINFPRHHPAKRMHIPSILDERAGRRNIAEITGFIAALISRITPLVVGKEREMERDSQRQMRETEKQKHYA
jgi:hypothetical protein